VARRTMIPSAAFALSTLAACFFLAAQPHPPAARAASTATAHASSARIPVFVSIVPQAYFVERVGGDLVDVEVLVGPGQSPHTYEPTPRQVARIARARVYFTIGVPLEKGLVPKLARSFPGLSIVDTTSGIRFIPMDRRHEHPRTQAGGQGHDHGGYDPHVWLDPGRVKIQASNICDALVRVDPAHAGVYRANLSAFLDDLDALDRELKEVFAPMKGSKVYVFHPAFGYLAQAYGFEQVAVEEEGKDPGARKVARLIAEAKAQGVRVIFVQPQFSAKKAQAIAERIGGAVVAIDPLPRDYLAQMRSLGRAVRDGVSGGRAGK